MVITIVGGGNIGTQLAVHCSEQGHSVVMYTSKPHLFNEVLAIVDDNGAVTHSGRLYKATNEPAEAFGNADLVLVTVPSLMMVSAASAMRGFLKRDAIIGVVPGNGGSECAFKEMIEDGHTFFAIERVPAVARLLEYGSTVRSVGYRKELHVSAIPHKDSAKCSELVESLLGIPCVTLPCFLCMTLTPSNPILHTSRLRTIFDDYHNGKAYDTLPLFYEEWDDASSELLLAMDDEVQSICNALTAFDLSGVKSLREHYESPDVPSMTRKISSIEAFKGLGTPSLITEEGLVPDLNSRYFTADFSFGLSIIKQIAEFAAVDTPFIDDVLNWYNGIKIHDEQFEYTHYGIKDLESFVEFYGQ